jgi:thioredoxin reductase (NADPH)
MTNSSKEGQRKADIMIIGGGPAGLSAYLWSTRLGVDAVLIERGSKFGGQLLSIFNPIVDYPGRVSPNGREFCKDFIAGIDGLEQGALRSSEVIEFDVRNIAAKLNDGTIVRSRAAIIATGVRRRRLNVPGESEFMGRGILESGTNEQGNVSGKRVAIIGGGDAAIENALILARRAEKVFVIHRRSEFRAREKFLAQAKRNPRIEFLLESNVRAFEGDDLVRSVKVETSNNRNVNSLPVDAILIRIGVEPNTEIFRDQLDLDDSGYIRVNVRGEASRPFIYAAGDVANRFAPTIVSAAGMAATAVKNASRLICGVIKV